MWDVDSGESVFVLGEGPKGHKMCLRIVYFLLNFIVNPELFIK